MQQLLRNFLHKKSAPFWIGFFIGMPSGGLLVFGFYFIIGQMFSPTIHTGEEAKASVERYFGISLPSSAGNFYYKREGFQDYMTDIRLTLPPQDASDFIQAYLEKLKEKYPDFEFSQNGAYSYNVSSRDSYESIYYDEETKRLSVYLDVR